MLVFCGLHSGSKRSYTRLFWKASTDIVRLRWTLGNEQCENQAEKQSATVEVKITATKKIAARKLTCYSHTHITALCTNRAKWRQTLLEALWSNLRKKVRQTKTMIPTVLILISQTFSKEYAQEVRHK